MGGFFGPSGGTSSGGSSSGAKLGARLVFASPAGIVAAAPVGFNSSIGILSVTLGAGNATWSSLTAGTAGQLCEIRNDDAANTLTLPQANWGGPAGVDTNLTPGNKALAYYDGTLAKWQLTSP